MEETAIAGTDVTAASSAADEWAGVDFGQVGETVAPPATAPEAHQDPEPASPQPEVQAEAPEAPAARADTTPPGVRRRIDKLTARAKQAEEERSNLVLEVERYKQALALVQEQHQTKAKRLQELDPRDPRDVELEALKFEQQIQQRQAELDRAYQTRVQEAERAARVDALAEKLLEEVEGAIERYPIFQEQEQREALALAMQRNPDRPVAELAQQINDRLSRRYEDVFAQKYRGRVDPPAPTVPGGSSARRAIATNDDLIAELDAEFGADWDHKR